MNSSENEEINSTHSTDESTKQEIIRGAQELFWTYGIRSVTMDDIANKLGMSKKTLYQYIKDKADLVYECAKMQLDSEFCNMDKALSESEHALDEVMKVVEYNQEFFLNFHPSLLIDLQRGFPKAWKLFLEHKEERFIKTITNNIIRGIQEGLYREDIEPTTLARMRMEQVQIIFNPQVYSPREYQLLDVHFQLFKHFIYGLVTPKGYELLTELLSTVKMFKR